MEYGGSRVLSYMFRNVRTVLRCSAEKSRLSRYIIVPSPCSANQSVITVGGQIPVRSAFVRTPMIDMMDIIFPNYIIGVTVTDSYTLNSSAII